jgi:phage gpG-like protein
MGTVMTVNLQEIEKLAQKLNAYTLTSVQQTSLLKGLGLEVEEQTKERFDTKLDPEGKRWRDITEAYRTFLVRPPSPKHPDYRGAQPPLIREGYMRESIEYQLTGSDSILIGSTREYADYHQNAKVERRRRTFLGLSADNIEDLQDMIATFMERHGL